ncbi:MAG TPA: deoxyribodipyrimidine photo-lyase [Planctomycetota bacterium]|nr:deoxyribodipyrimidine photo-lyase [Planctomycetota bacterium]
MTQTPVFRSVAVATPLADRCAADPRLRMRRDGELRGASVVYWMQRSQRARDNAALDFAIETADALGLPVHVFFAPVPFFPRANLRAYDFLFRGVPDLAREVRARGASFVFRVFPDHDLAAFAREVQAALVVGDENPLRETEAWRQEAARRLAVPFVTVDADVVVPTACFPKQEFAARTLRPKHRALLDTFLAAPTTPRRARVAAKAPPPSLDPDAAAVPEAWRIDRSVPPVRSVPSGPVAARAALDAFLAERLTGYAETRNRPDLDACSRLSAYLHFGHLGPAEVARAVRAADAPQADREAFLEELLVRRELAINFAARNPDYDRLQGCPAWALRTLDAHRRDPRPFLYDAATLRDARTHDPLWNAAQREMTRSGRMHGYCRMYWAKKLLEWTPSPEAAFEIATDLNDARQLDGRDPNGYAGIAWAIGGLHDRPWFERPVFGAVRYMNAAGAARKFDVDAYVRRVDALPQP